jgi:hypothetical protein
MRVYFRRRIVGCAQTGFMAGKAKPYARQSAEPTHHLDEGTGNVFSLYAFDPETGVPLREYFSPRDLGYGLACTDGNEFTFVMVDAERKSLKLLKLAPATLPKSG